MDKHALWKWLILVVLVAGSLAVVMPPMDVTDDEGHVVRQGKIRLGIDLEGGTSFTVQIDRDAVRGEIIARGKGLTEEQIESRVAEALKDAHPRALEILRGRIDSLGIEEPNIYAGKNERIIIQLPGISEKMRENAERSIKSAAFLEFRMVHEDNASLTAALFDAGKLPPGYKAVMIENERYLQRSDDYKAVSADPDYYRKLGMFEVPSRTFEFMVEKREVGGHVVYMPTFVNRRREMTGEHLDNAKVEISAMGQAVIKLDFDSQGADDFARVTADYAPGGARNPDPNRFQRLGIVLDDTLYSAPRINEAIYGGRAEISGAFKLPEANLLAHILNAGSLPAPVKIIETRHVSASLGEDSITSGKRAILMGGVAVLVFMLVYYMVCGLVADLALFLNMILLPLGMIIAAGFLSIFAGDVAGGASIKLPVLTLPGIAGILLTIGMAVDANVLIFERIREEARSGKRLWTAIAAGYDRAFVTIVDANVTTLLTGAILFIFGSGPIRGFAVTLSAGILVSMFTSLVVTRLFFGVLVKYTSLASLKMLSIIRKTNIDFVSKRKFAAVLSVAVIVVSWGLMLPKNSADLMGVDFTGGTTMTFSFDMNEEVPIDTLRTTLEGAGLADVGIQYQQEIGVGGKRLLEVKTSAEAVNDLEPATIATATLQKAFPKAVFERLQEDEVGPQVGRELRRRALWSILLALLGIILYVAWRFELGFAVGAIVALAHDVLITVGIYTLFGRQLSLPIVAALLTIVGYSVNDTIVVFDRIREDLRTVRGQTFKAICNLSINQTLSRTLLTSITTLIAVVMLLLFGGGAIQDFALALCIGIIVGTYSSIFVATPVVLLWHHDRTPEFATRKQ